MSSRLITRVVLLALVSVACSPLAHTEKPSAPGPEGKPLPSEALARLPLSFVENRGQVPDGDIAHYVNTPSTSIGFTPTGLRLALTDTQGTAQRWGLALDFVGGRARPEAKDLHEGVVSYFKGDPSEWKTNLPTHGQLVYRDVWPRIDLVYRSDGPNLKYELLVHPGGDPDDIRFRWRGATEVFLDPDGSLRASTPAGSITDGEPLSFQGTRRVASSYELRGTTYGFRVGDYDRSRTLVIDPAIFVYAGYIGGTGHDLGNGIDVDASGAAYVTGFTDSGTDSFPETVGPILTKITGNADAFVAKVNPAGTALVYAGFIGGNVFDSGEGIAVDASGAAYVVGTAGSHADTFPETGGPFLTNSGGDDAFVAKVNPSGTALSYAGFIGGAGDDDGEGIAVDASGAAYVTGRTTSDAATFPEIVGPFLTKGMGYDAFVAKVSPSGAALSYAGYIGGDGDDQGYGIDVDASGAAYVTGAANSDAATFPETVGPDLTFDGGDAFVAKVNPSGTAFSYAGYIGGNGYEAGYGIAVDSSGSAYVTGETAGSEPTTFPVPKAAFSTTGMGTDAFVAKVNPSGTALSYAGFIGGDAIDVGYGIAVDASGAAYVTGETSSYATTFPETEGPFLAKRMGKDAFVAKVNPTATVLTYAGYIGGDGDDNGNGIAVDSAGAAYVTGVVRTSDPLGTDAAMFPVTVGPDLTYNGGLYDAFVAKVTDNLCLGKGVTIQGTADAEAITGTSGNDVILGLGGDDTIDGAGGNDTICAGDGDDVLVGGEGDDALDGEAGSDTASFPGSTSVTADLLAGTASGASTDTLAGIENLIGSSSKDILTGDGGPNRLQGGPGADRLSGRKGADRLAGQRGADNLLGGRGNDRLSGGRGRDRLSGGKGRDRCAGGKGSDTASGCEKTSGV
jgi:Ca2+-binding RTX toxin-like protein